MRKPREVERGRVPYLGRVRFQQRGEDRHHSHLALARGLVVGEVGQDGHDVALPVGVRGPAQHLQKLALNLAGCHSVTGSATERDEKSELGNGCHARDRILGVKPAGQGGDARPKRLRVLRGRPAAREHVGRSTPSADRDA